MTNKTKKFFNGHKAYDKLDHRPYNEDLVFTINTKLKTSGSIQTFYIPLPLDVNYLRYDCTIYWGDGASTKVNWNSDFNLKVIDHVYPPYPSSNTWTIRIKGRFAGMDFLRSDINYLDTRNEISGSAEAIVSLDNWGTSAFYYATNMFDGCRNMEPNYPYNQPPNTSSVTDFSRMFRDCKK